MNTVEQEVAILAMIARAAQESAPAPSNSLLAVAADCGSAKAKQLLKGLVGKNRLVIEYYSQRRRRFIIEGKSTGWSNSLDRAPLPPPTISSLPPADGEDINFLRRRGFVVTRTATGGYCLDGRPADAEQLGQVVARHRRQAERAA